MFGEPTAKWFRDDLPNYVTTGDLVWYCPFVSGGKIAARIVGDINYEARTCTIQITARTRAGYPHKSFEYEVPATAIFKRNHWAAVTIAPQWLIQWHKSNPAIVSTYHYGHEYRQEVQGINQTIRDFRLEFAQAHNAIVWYHAGPADGGESRAANSVLDILAKLKERGRVERGWTTWAIA